MVNAGDNRKRILAVGLDRAAFSSLDALLCRSRFSVDRVRAGAGGLMLCQNVAFDLILFGAAGPGSELREFIAAARGDGSASAGSELLVLARGDDLAMVRRELPADRAAALSVAEPTVVLQEVAARLLGVSPRRTARLPVRLRVELDSGQEMRFCQTENISSGGMLVRTQPRPPEGTRLSFEFSIPGELEPVRGTGAVARRSVSDVEGVVGVGVRFLEFQGAGRAQLEGYLDRLTRETP